MMAPITVSLIGILRCVLLIFIVMTTLLLKETHEYTPPEMTPSSTFYDPDARAPLGSIRPASVFLDELDIVPSPSEFNRRYVSRYQPVIFRGAAKQSRAYHLWTEEYLIQNYGNLTVRLEARREEDSAIPAGVGGLGRDTMEHFLQHYQSTDTYVITQLASPMEHDVSVPPCLTCGSFSRSIQEVNLFLSSRGGKTLLHRDPLSSLHCVFNGTKQWIVIDPKQKASLYMADDSTYEFGGYSVIDVNILDLEKFPKMKDVEYARVLLNKGDCIYMPSGYMHQVRSNGYLNSAVSIWFSHYYDFDDVGCDDAPRGSVSGYRPLNELDMLWRFSGHGNMSIGRGDVFMLRTVLLTLADEDGKIWIDNFLTNFVIGHPDRMHQSIEIRNTLRPVMDSNDRGFITVEEVNNYPVRRLKEFCLILSGPDVSDTDTYEFSIVRSIDIKKLYKKLLRKSKDGTFTRKEFTESYVNNLEGTSIYANAILNNFGQGLDIITAEMVDRLGDMSVAKFVEDLDHDPTAERVWYKHLVRKGIIQKFNVVHDEL